MKNKIVRIQAGHYPRKTGSTGAYNSELRISEQNENYLLWQTIRKEVTENPVAGVTFQFIEADERLYSSCDVFIALHMDGSNSSIAQGPSVGYPVSSKTSKAFAQLFKERYQELDPPNSFRSDNYTSGLRNYYGYKSSYSGAAPVKMVFENGFVTNTDEVTWAQNNRLRVAEMVIRVAMEHLGTTLDISKAWKVAKSSPEGEYSWAVLEWQRRLNAWGADPQLHEDGRLGAKTKAAHRAWSAVHYPSRVSDLVGRAQWKKLLKDPQASVKPPVVITDPEPTDSGTEKLMLDLKEAYEAIKTEQAKAVQREQEHDIDMEMATLRIEALQLKVEQQADTIRDMTKRATRAREILDGSA